MSKAAKKSVSCAGRQFKVLSQGVLLGDINFRKRSLTGCTELSVLPLTSTGRLWRLTLNCKQCRILHVTVNGVHSANFSYADPLLSVCPPDSKKRSLEFFVACHQEAVRSCDNECVATGGELIVKIPKDVYSTPGLNDWKPLQISIDFSLEQPKGGVQFVVPSGSDAMQQQHCHVFSCENQPRLWFPCVDLHSQLCPWSIRLTVPSSMTAVSCGELTDQLLSPDGRKKTFHYTLSVPTAAPCIAFAVGCFEVYPDPVLQEVTHFCPPGLLPLLKNSVQFIHEVFGFYEELLSSRFPYGSYKLVFVDQCYNLASSYSTMGIFSVELLHSPRVIEQVFSTRRTLALAIAQQYFGCYMLPNTWSDWWLAQGIAGFLAGLYSCRAFGNTDHQHWLIEEQRRVCEYECGHSLPPLSAAAASGSGASGELHVLLLSEPERNCLQSKAQLVLRMIQLKIGQDLLLQVFNKLLTLASTASADDTALWINLSVSTAGFVKAILTVSGKDLSHLMEQWVYKSGAPRFHCSFSFLRKKNIVELRLKQDLARTGSCKFTGSMSVVVQEFDGCFSHNIQVEDALSVQELPCHSKIRKSKKRKVPLSHGEEVDVDVSSLDNEVPVLWVKVDPDMQWIRQISMQQSDTVCQCVLKYDRDAVAQLEAVAALEGLPSEQSRNCLRDALLNPAFYHRVRCRAAQALATMEQSPPSFLIALYQRLFGSQPHPSIPRYNDFTDVGAYFVQKAMPVCMASMRNTHKQCPKEVLSFLLDLLKYNDNETNMFSDSYMLSALIDALCAAITPRVSVSLPAGVDVARSPAASLSADTQALLQELVVRLNLESVLPSYKHAVTVSCLKCLRELQRNGHLPADSSLFRSYASSCDNYIDVRLAAFSALVDVLQVEQGQAELDFLLDVVETDPVPTVRLAVVGMLVARPPFIRRSDSQLNTVQLVERLWSLMCTKLAHDARLRNSVALLYGALYGRLTPPCVPQGLGVVIDLKEKVARTSMASPAISPNATEELVPTSVVASATPSPAAPQGLSLRISLPAAGIGEGSADLLHKPKRHKEHKAKKKHKKHKKKNK